MSNFKFGDRELTFTYTRKIAREVEEQFMSGVMVRSTGGVQDMEMPAINTQRGEELKVRLVSGLSPEEIDTMDNGEYEKLAEAVNKFIEKKKA